MNNDKYYIYKKIGNDIVVYKIRNLDEYQKYIYEHNGQAPLISVKATMIHDTLLGRVDGLKEIHLPASIKYIDGRYFKKFRGIRIIFGDYYIISTKEMTPDKKKVLCLRIIGIYDHDKFISYLKSSNGKAPSIPNGVCFIGEYVFKDIIELKKIDIPSSCTALYKQSFMNTGLREINISPRTIYFGEELFKNCKNLKKIDIPKTIRFIKPNVFAGCNEKIDITIFDDYHCDLSNFNLDGSLKNKFNLEENDLKSKHKTLRVNNGFYLIISGKTYYIEKDKFPSMKYDKFTGHVMRLYDDIMEVNKGYNLFVFSKYNKDLPPAFIINNTCVRDIKSFSKNYDFFVKSILNKIKEISMYKSENKNGLYVHRITEKQYITLYKIAVICGLFEKNVDNNKISNLFIQQLFGLDSNCKKTLRLSIDDFVEIFGNIDGEVTYNKEFSDNFLYNYQNLVKLTSTVKKATPCLLNTIYQNCGESKILYEHDNVYIKSLGKMHDQWLKYKANNAHKERNDGNSKKESSVLSFVDWALQYDKNLFNNFHVDMSDKDMEIISPFRLFYNDEKPYIRLLELFHESMKVVPYNYIDINGYNVINKKVNVAAVGFPGVVREIPTIEIDDNYSTNYDGDKKLRIYKWRDYCAYILAKSDPVFAYYNCQLANCSNVMANGCEYLYESYLHMDCQPFAIINTKYNEPVGTFRLDLNRKDGYGIINCFEVSTRVKFEYSKSEKDNVVNVFYNIILNYIKLYNKYNANKLKYVTLGQITHCGINDVLATKFKVLDKPVKLEYDRKIAVFNPNNHFIIWSLECDNE